MQQGIEIENFRLQCGKWVNLELTYRIFGCAPGTAPVIVVNHTLTGNAEVAGANGWWKTLIGYGEAIDLEKCTVVAFNIPGNGQHGNSIENYFDFTVKDIAGIFLQGLRELQMNKILAIIGGSLGGAIAWEMAYQNPDLAELVFPIATDFQCSDWIVAQCHVQQTILLNSKTPVQDARKHAMLMYRTPESLNQRFQYKNTDEKAGVAEWLDFHGNALYNRFSLQSYLFMNHLLSTIWVTDNTEDLKKINAEIHVISIDSDNYFTHQRAVDLVANLKSHKKNVFLHTIHSVHGHDAFLMEYEQLAHIIRPILQSRSESKITNQYQNQSI